MSEQTEENQIRKKSGLGSFFLLLLLLPLQIFLFTFFVSFKITKLPSSFACHIRFSSTLPCPTTPLSPAVSSSLPVSTALTTSLPPIPSPPAVPLSLSTQAASIDQTVSYRHCQYLSPLVWTQKETSGNFRFSFFYFPSYSSSKTAVGMMCRMKPRAAVEGDSSMQMTDSAGCLSLGRRCWRGIDEQKLKVRASPVPHDLLSAREERIYLDSQCQWCSRISSEESFSFRYFLFILYNLACRIKSYAPWADSTPQFRPLRNSVVWEEWETEWVLLFFLSNRNTFYCSTLLIFFPPVIVSED